MNSALQRWFRMLLAGGLLHATLPARGALTETSARAVLVFQLTKFVTWPDSGPRDAFRIGILGPDRLGATLEEIVAGEKVGGREIVIRRAATAASLVECQMVYVSPEARETPAQALAVLQGRGILTVGESEEFLAAGGMVRLAVTPERKVRLQINLESVRAGLLAMSAQLLRVADIVKGAAP